MPRHAVEAFNVDSPGAYEVLDSFIEQASPLSHVGHEQRVVNEDVHQTREPGATFP